MNIKVRWLKSGKRQSHRFGACEQVEAGQVCDWDEAELERYAGKGEYEVVAEYLVDEGAAKSPVPDNSAEASAPKKARTRRRIKKEE